MKFTDALIPKLEKRHLLKHEFYQAWSSGSVPIETLQLYARQYYHHVDAFPRYISSTHSLCDDIRKRQILLENLNDEEKGVNNHPELWMRFAEGLGLTREDVHHAKLLPETQDLIHVFYQKSRQSYADGLGALFAYEHQIPEIATFKTEALQKYYDFEEPSTLEFFKVHQEADIYHTQALSSLLDQLSATEKLEAEKTALVAADQLWKFLDGIYRNMPV